MALVVVVHAVRAVTVAMASTGAAGGAITTALVVTTRTGASWARTLTLPPGATVAPVVLVALEELRARTATVPVRARPLAGHSPVA